MSFQIDTGSSGASLGPWVTWSSNGSAMKGIPHSTWVLRGKDEAGNKYEKAIPAFVNGCVMDLDSLKQGWEKDGAKGTAPERRWNPTLAVYAPRPDDSKKPSGAHAWSKALSVRLAIGGGQAATWEQASFSSFDAYERVIEQVRAQWAEHSQNGTLLPLVKQTGVRRVDLANGPANIAELTIVKWVPRPDCLKADAPVIAVAPAPVVAAPPPVQPSPAAMAAIPNEAAF